MIDRVYQLNNNPHGPTLYSRALVAPLLCWKSERRPQEALKSCRFRQQQQQCTVLCSGNPIQLVPFPHTILTPSKSQWYQYFAKSYLKFSLPQTNKKFCSSVSQYLLSRQYIQSLTIAIVFELIYYTNGHFQGMTDIHEYIQNAMPTYYINQFFMSYIS